MHGRKPVGETDMSHAHHGPARHDGPHGISLFGNGHRAFHPGPELHRQAVARIRPRLSNTAR